MNKCDKDSGTWYEVHYRPAPEIEHSYNAHYDYRSQTCYVVANTYDHMMLPNSDIINAAGRSTAELFDLWKEKKIGVYTFGPSGEETCAVFDGRECATRTEWDNFIKEFVP